MNLFSGINSADVLNNIDPYLEAYGYYLIFLALFLENTVIIGLILPGETILLAAGFFSARGVFSLPVVITIGFFAALSGNVLGYALGRLGGYAFIKRFGDSLHISQGKIGAAEAYFETHGGKTIFLGRFASVIRVFISLIAGASKMRFLPFFIYTFLAVLAWTLAACYLGFYFGQNWEILAKAVAGFGWLLLILIIALVALIWWRNRR